MKKILENLSWSQKIYFIFITRKVYGFLLINVLSVYTLSRNNNTIVNLNAYKKFNERYLGDIKYMLTEDSSSGRQYFFEQLCESRLKEFIHYDKNSLPACFNRNLLCKSCKSFSMCELKKKLDESDIITGVLTTLPSLCSEQYSHTPLEK